jgi:prefoldin subunit 5
MEKSNNNQSSEPVTTADLGVMKTEIIEVVKNSVQGLATQETVNAIMETVAETKEGMTGLTGRMQDMLEELTTTHEDVRYVRHTVTMLAQSDAAHDAAIESLRKRVERVEKKSALLNKHLDADVRTRTIPWELTEEQRLFTQQPDDR